MKKIAIFLLLLMWLPFASADTVKDLVRVSCVPELGLLDVEYRHLHDSVAGDYGSQDGRDRILAKSGFHNPRGLKLSCELGGITYAMSADQDSPSNRLCGGSPEIYLSLMRGSEKVLSEVIFGNSCNQRPTVTRITIGDGPRSWRGRETEVCYSTGKDDDAGFCDWTFAQQGGFDKRFPIDENRLRRIVSHEERR